MIVAQHGNQSAYRLLGCCGLAVHRNRVATAPQQKELESFEAQRIINWGGFHWYNNLRRSSPKRGSELSLSKLSIVSLIDHVPNKEPSGFTIDYQCEIKKRVEESDIRDVLLITMFKAPTQCNKPSFLHEKLATVNKLLSNRKFFKFFHLLGFL